MGPGTGGPATFYGREIAGYRLESVLGVGLTGAVYLARLIAGDGESATHTGDPQKPGEVAIKILLPSWEISADDEKQKDFRRRFDREAETLKRLKHPNIVSVLDSGVEGEDNLAYMVMPYLSGGTLGEHMAEGKLPFTEAERWIKQLADALDYAHGAGVIHRDIKPQNVMLDSADNALLADFSIVRLMNETRTKQTTEGRLLGSPAYMAPEQIRSGKVSAASDIYSLGILCFAMVTGQAPFERESTSVAELLFKVVQESPPLPRSLRPDLPESAEAVIWQALDKQPERRFTSATAFAEAFSAGLQGVRLPYVRPMPVVQDPSLTDWSSLTVSEKTPVPEDPPPLPSRGLKKPGPVPLLLGAVVLLLISVLVLGRNGLGALLTPSSSPGTPNIGLSKSTATDGEEHPRADRHAQAQHWLRRFRWLRRFGGIRRLRWLRWQASGDCDAHAHADAPTATPKPAPTATPIATTIENDYDQLESVRILPGSG